MVHVHHRVNPHVRLVGGVLDLFCGVLAAGSGHLYHFKAGVPRHLEAIGMA